MPDFASDQSSLTIHKSPTSAAFHGFVRRLHLASQSDDPVLLAGEVGTGKRQSASTIHNVGARSGGNFVQIDCLGIKESKFELEMLGALNPYNHQLRQGAVGLAEGGTLYLHEVGELPAACQTLLLRLVESNTYSPVNSSDTYNSDFRLITSSSQDLMAMVEHGKFRNDLLHHINTLTIRTPSLNERRDDIADLVRSILLEMPTASAKQLTPEAMDVLCHHKYTANILELRNIIHRLVGTFETDVYSEHHVIQSIYAGTPSSKSERVIEKKSQRSMLPDFKDYIAYAHKSAARAQHDADKPQEQPSFIAQGHTTYASTTYHIHPTATSPEDDLDNLSEQDVADDEFLAAQMAGQNHGQAYMAQHFNAAPPRFMRPPSTASNSGDDEAGNPFTALKAQERDYILKLIEFCDGDKKKAAEIAGVTLRTLYRKIKQ
jgi:DNA-binding NtrC family response regulator